MEDKYYTIDEALVFLGEAGLKVTDRTIRNWINRGSVKAIRPGGRQWYIHASEIRRLLNEGKSEGNSLPVYEEAA